MLWRAFDLYVALLGAIIGLIVDAVKKVIGLRKDRLKYAPPHPTWGARVAHTLRGTRYKKINFYLLLGASN